MASHRILIGNIPERSSFNAALIVAELLRAHGHRPFFVGDHSSEFRQHIGHNGFEYFGIGPRDIDGIVKDLSQTRNPVRLWKLTAAIEAETISSMEELAANHRDIDLALLDVFATFPASYFLSKLRIPTMLINNTYSSRFSLAHPPVYSEMRPSDTTASPSWQRFRHLLAWGSARFRRQVVEPSSGGLVNALVGTIVYSPGQRRARRAAEHNGWRFCWGEWGHRPRLPEVVVGHRALDWPALRESDQRVYVASGIASRMEFDSTWESGLDKSKPLVYCNLSTLFTPQGIRAGGREGSLSPLAERVKRFLHVVVAAFADNPQWQLLLACGPFVGTLEASALPKNARVVERVPQLSVLERTAITITHGGAGTVRECAARGVPMLVFPMWSDQSGNAARVQHLRLGLNGGSYRTLTTARLVDLLERMMRDPEIASSVADFKNRQVRDPEAEWNDFQAFIARHTPLAL